MRAWSRPLRLEIVAEDRGGGEGIAALLFAASRETGLRHAPVGVGGAESFVVQDDGQTKSLFETSGEGAGTRGTGTFGVVHVQRQAEHEAVAGGEVLSSGAPDGADEFSFARCGDFDDGQGRGEAREVIAEGEAGAPLAEIDAEVAPGHGQG